MLTASAWMRWVSGYIFLVEAPQRDPPRCAGRTRSGHPRPTKKAPTRAIGAHESRERLSTLRKRRGQYQQLDISPPYGPVIKLNCHSIGRINRAFVPTFRPNMPRPVHPGSRGLAKFIDKIEIPSILRDKYGAGLASCASLYALKLTREVEHLRWRGRRSLRDDNRRNNPLHRSCRRHVIIERSRRAGAATRWTVVR